MQKDTLGSLNNDAQRQQFDNYSRRYRNMWSADIGQHTDQQSSAWYGQVADGRIKSAQDTIASNPLNPTAVQQASFDIVDASAKKAELMGAAKGDPVWTAALDQGNKLAFSTRVKALADVAPSRAMSMLQAHPELAGTDYPQLYSDLNIKAGQQDGQDAFNLAMNNHVQGVAQTRAQITSDVQKVTGLNPTAGMLNNNPGNIKYDPSIQWQGQTGPSQNTDQGSPQVVFNSPEAGMRALAKNVIYKYTRGATTIQQLIAGPGGWTPGYQPGAVGVANAAGLPLNAPINMNDPAVLQKVMRGIVTQEHGQASTYYSDSLLAGGVSAALHSAPGTEVAPVAQSPTPIQAPVGRAVAQPVAAQSDTAPQAQPIPLAPISGQPAAPTGPETEPAIPAANDPHANAMQAILGRSGIDAGRQDAAITTIDKLWQAQQIADDQTTAQAKAQSEQAMAAYTMRINQGDYPTLDQLSKDNRLTAEDLKSLPEMMRAHADESVSGSTFAYGPGYWPIYRMVTAEPGSQNRVTSAADIYRMAGPGGPINVSGAQKLVGILGQMQKPDQASLETAKKALLAYAHDRISFQQDPQTLPTGVAPQKDARGELLFNRDFIPQFESAFSTFTEKGGDPWKFVQDTDGLDAMISRTRNSREMALAKLEADNKVDADQMDLPPAPLGADPQAWREVSAIPAVSKSGVTWTPGMWNTAISTLLQNPTPEVKQQFNEQFPSLGYDADTLLNILKPPAMSDTQAEEARRVNAAEAKSADRDEIPGMNADGQPIVPPAAFDPRLGLGRI